MSEERQRGKPGDRPFGTARPGGGRGQLPGL